MSNIGFEIRLNASYDEALQRATAALKEEGFGVLTTIDVKETLKAKLNVDFRRYVILGACNPPLAHRALNTDLDVGLLLPCNVIVYEQDSGAVVSIVESDCDARRHARSHARTGCQRGARALAAGREQVRTVMERTMSSGIDLVATAQTKARYNRIARIYDLVESMSERRFKPWREKLWQQASGNVLEAGVGTGKNFPYHPHGAKVTGIDLSDQMLIRARNALATWVRRLICAKATCRRSTSLTIRSTPPLRRSSFAPFPIRFADCVS